LASIAIETPAHALRELARQLDPLRARFGDAERAGDLLERDLLPRLVPGPAHLVAAIVGPNNAGKSALFNAIAGRELSPSVPEGGATQRALGAAHPELIVRLQAEPTLARFRLRPATGDPRPLALAAAENLDELNVASSSSLPPHLMLIDTPDFDSIIRHNRAASESVLMVADLVIAVVTRHSYQNREVVVFLRDWLQHGRPWIVVYNEASDAEIAARHVDKLIADVGNPPAARFWAPYSLAVQTGQEALAPKPLVGNVAAADLSAWLHDASAVGRLKQLSFAAALGRLHLLVGGTVEAIRSEERDAAQVLRVALAHADRLSGDVAHAAMPGEAFVDAFRTVLDRRTNAISRSWRGALRSLRSGIERVPRLLWNLGREPKVDPNAKREETERKALAELWPGFWEELVRDLGPEKRHPARRHADADIGAALDADLTAPQRRETALAQALATLPLTQSDLDSFRSACEKLIEQAIEDRGFDIDIQAAADLATLAPLALASAVVLTTHGIGVDLAAAGGGALSTYLIDKYTHLLGSDILSNARERWISLRGGHISPIVVAASLPSANPTLQQRSATSSATAKALESTLAGLAESAKGQHAAG